MPNITNAQVNAAASAIPVSWFGPATRVTNVESPQLTNTNDFVVTVAHGDGNTTSVTINYDELTNEAEYKPIIFGAVIDDFALAVSAPYGPLTRTTPITSLPTNPAHAFDTNISFALASPYNDKTIQLTYNELKYPAIVLQRLKGVVGVSSSVKAIADALSTLNATAQAMTAPYDDNDYETLIDGVRNLNYLVGGFQLN